ncbi:MAG: hypothetical protein KDI02_22115, partial [Anaerolineae bacterium]|nr:hypothetical protein [Anaerolineae bacterium]
MARGWDELFFEGTTGAAGGKNDFSAGRTVRRSVRMIRRGYEPFGGGTSISANKKEAADVPAASFL